MKKDIIYSLRSPFRDEFRIHGFRFGSGRKSIAIVGAMRGDEVQQQFVASQLVRELQIIEARGDIAPDHEILIVPSANHFSMNIGKRFWAMDNTDINRMFPGYDKGETTQRIAAALFESLQGYAFGIQFASFYLPGDFIPHVRITHTGYEDVSEAVKFGLPYVYTPHPKPYDTTILNYNWQIWKTQAFSVYVGHTESIDEADASNAVRAVLRFMSAQGIIRFRTHPGYSSQILSEKDVLPVKTPKAGILSRMCKPDDHVSKGQVLGRVLDPYDGTVRWELTAPKEGTVFFISNRPLVLENALIFRLIPDSQND